MTGRPSIAARLAIWQVCALAFLAMCVQDLLGTVMVVFEAHYNAAGAGTMDVLGYIAQLAGAALALDSILNNGVWNRRSVAIIASVSVANYAGTWTGVAITHALAAGAH